MGTLTPVASNAPTDRLLAAEPRDKVNTVSDHLVVMVATYNRLELLKKVLDSIRLGTASDHEIIVIDGGSTDGTIEFLHACPFVTPVFQGALLGTARCYNEVWRRIASRYSCWLSDDTELVPGSLDLAVSILEGDREIGMVGLKMRDTRGPGKTEPYRGGISEYGILNCNHGVLPTELAREVGFFNESYRSYMIDPDLTASVLCSGRRVVMTKAVAVLHHREWAETEGEEKVLRDMAGINNALIYHEKFRFLAASDTWPTRLRAWVLRHVTRLLFLGTPATSQRLWLNRRDWYNFAAGRFIRLLDPVVNLDRPYHLTQSIPADLPRRATERPPEPFYTAVKHGMRRYIGDQSWFALSRAKTGSYRVFERVMMAGVNRLPARVRLSLRARTTLLRRLDYPKGDIFINVDSEQEFWMRANSCSKEPEMAVWIETFFKPDDVFFDVGANVGAYSLLAAKVLGGRIAVYAFEPAAINYAQLSRNIFTNRFSSCVFPMPIAVSDRTVLDWFNYANLTPGGSFHAFGEPVDYIGHQFHPVFRQPVISYRIDDLIAAFRIPQPTHMKIDVDGIEFKVLLGADRALDQVQTVIFELNHWDAEALEITRYLESKGLTLHSRRIRQSEDGGDPGSRIGNYLFVRSSIPDPA